MIVTELDFQQRVPDHVIGLFADILDQQGLGRDLVEPAPDGTIARSEDMQAVRFSYSDLLAFLMFLFLMFNYSPCSLREDIIMNLLFLTKAQRYRLKAESKQARRMEAETL